MSINSTLRVIRVLAILAMTALAATSALAQVPAATPNPAQRDATRPPGQGQNQPEPTRPTSARLKRAWRRPATNRPRTPGRPLRD